MNARVETRSETRLETPYDRVLEGMRGGGHFLR
jgi:hypothetical protein